MTQHDFETAITGRKGRPPNRVSGRPSSRNPLVRYRPQIVVCVLVVAVLVGGAYYSSRASEAVPKVVYSTSLDEAVAEANRPLLVDINTADTEDLDELPGVGPSTAGEIIAHRTANGPFATVDDLEAVPGIGPKTLEKIRPFAKV